MDIGAGHLPRDSTGSDLREAWEPLGRVASAHVVPHNGGDEPRTWGWVGMPSHGAAASAALGVHGRMILNLREER